MPPTILLIAPESAALPVADDLRRDLRAEVETAPNHRSALASLRRREFTLILIDESLATADAGAAGLVYQNCGGALVVELNFAISSVGRIVRQTRAALNRQSQDRTHARAAVAAGLQSELNAVLSGILLESELALREANLEQVPRLRHLVQLATELRDRLRTS